MIRTIFDFIINYSHYLLISLVAVLTPVKPMLLTVGFLVVSDFIFGLYKSYKKGLNITSRKMSNTITKLLLYTITILAVFFLETYIITDVLPFTKLVAGLISLVEIKSIDEHFNSLFGYSIWSKLRAFIDRGKSTTKDVFDDIDNIYKKN